MDWLARALSDWFPNTPLPSPTLHQFDAVYGRPAFSGHPYVSCFWIQSNTVEDIGITLSLVLWEQISQIDKPVILPVLGEIMTI